jgi:BolA protein
MGSHLSCSKSRMTATSMSGMRGARDGRGHFSVRIRSPKFHGMSPLARHRAVYAALAELMQTDIHALAIDARAPEEDA